MIDSFSGANRWLSNFWPCRVQLDGEWYGSVEAAYVAGKTTDKQLRKRIQELEKPGQAKRFGRTIELRDDWERIKVPLMLDLLRQKFAKHTFLGNMLVATGDQELVEGNTWGDTFWGSCRGKGLNTLGILLMQVRSEISK